MKLEKSREMDLIKPIKLHDVTDYDFIFNLGAKISLTVDHDAGDTAEERADRYVINTKQRPGIVPGEVIEAAETEVFKEHLAMLSRRNRKQRMPTEEEAMDMQTLIKMAKGIN